MKATGKTIIALTDLDDEVRYFGEQGLMDQLAGARIPGTEPIKAAMRNFAQKVSYMRELQRKYFSAPYGSPEKQGYLNRSKKAEQEVDQILKNLNQTLEKL